VRTEFLDEGQRHLTVSSFADYFEVGVLRDAEFQSTSHDWMIISDQDSNFISHAYLPLEGISTVITVP
jgi:hypothetical protein